MKISTILDNVPDGNGLRIGLGATVVRRRNPGGKKSLEEHQRIVHNKDQLSITSKTTLSAGIHNNHRFSKFTKTVTVSQPQSNLLFCTFRFCGLFMQ